MSQQKARVMLSFKKLWSDLFSTPVHLDSALSKLPDSVKSAIAQMIPFILQKPASLAQALGIGVPFGEPWNLKSSELAEWKVAEQIADRLFGQEISQKAVRPILEDFPPEMTQEWTNDWGSNTSKELLNSLSSKARIGLRASRKTGTKKLIANLKEEISDALPFEVSALAPLGVTLSHYAPIINTSSHERGEFEIQDEGSQVMAVFALWPELYGDLLANSPQSSGVSDKCAPTLPKDPPAWTVIDACAGAGGKTLALADALDGKGRVYAYDTSEKKLQALRRRAKRAGLTNIQAVQVLENEESNVVERFRRRADCVLVDAPCSGWGVLKRNPDIKWRQTRDSLDRMPALQLRLLNSYCDLVRREGKLVYGVCTFRKAETVNVIEKFLEQHPEFEPLQGGFLGPGTSDGFFMQALVRKN